MSTSLRWQIYKHRVTFGEDNVPDFDDIIESLNAQSVEDVRYRLKTLTLDEFCRVLYEYFNRPDNRFGDNLLVALSAYCFEGRA